MAKARMIGQATEQDAVSAAVGSVIRLVEATTVTHVSAALSEYRHHSPNSIGAAVYAWMIEECGEREEIRRYNLICRVIRAALKRAA